MNNLEKAIETISDLLDEMSDIMDVDASGDPDNAMRWATQVSDALVRLKRHAKADTKTGVDLCQGTPPAAPDPMDFMTLRDYFAGKAMLRANAGLSDEDFAKYCYRIADAMLKAGEQPQ